MRPATTRNHARQVYPGAMTRHASRRHGSTHGDLDLNLTFEVAEVRRRLARGGDVRPRAGDVTSGRARQRPWQAATAVVVVPGDNGAEIAFIRRSEREGDPWSGHMALPGGRHDDDDVDLAATARRETHEEIGVALGDHVARLPDQAGRTSRGLVAAFVHVLDHRPPLRPEPREVAEALWIPLHRLADPATSVRVRWAGIPLPAIDHDGRVIWGLTHRIVQSFLEALRDDPGR